jgi:hypothetical protein
MSITPGGCGHVQWSLPGAPDNGWDAITFPFTVHTAPDAAGWYFAQMFSFIGGNSGYCGVRPRPGGRQLAAFSIFGNGTSVVDTERCRPTADGGPGTSCSAWAPLVRSRTYLFTVYREEPGSRVWRGLLTDGETGEQWPLGAWALSHEGGIKPTQVGFMEYYKAVESCEDTPMASLHFGAPYHPSSGASGRCHTPVHYGRCRDRLNYAAEVKPDGRVWMRAGWPTRVQRRANTGVNVQVSVTVEGSPQLR